MFQRANGVAFIKMELCNVSCDHFNLKWS